MRYLLFFIACLVLWSGAPRVSAQDSSASVLREIEFQEATVQDAIRLISDLTGYNIVATRDAGQRRFTLFLRALTVDEAIDSIARVAGLWHRRNPQTGVILVMTTEEYFQDLVVYREEVTEFFTLRYQNVVQVARTIESMFGTDRVLIDLRDEGDDLRLPDATLDEGRRGDRSFRGSLSGRRGAARDTDAKAEIGRLTTEQIELLERTVEQRPGEDPLLLSESTLAAVRRQSSQLAIFVAVNREHNQLFVRTADEKAMAEIRRLVRESDRPTPQVLLETKILSVQIDDEFQYAFDFSFNSEVLLQGPNDGQPPNPLNPSSPLGSEGTLGIVNANIAPGSSFVFQAMNDKVRARLQLLEREGRVDILATPMLLAANNRPAKIFIGEETVLTTGFTGSTSTVTGGTGNTVVTQPIPTTETVEVGNTLTILPSINADRTVVMRMLQEVSRVKPNGATIPVVTGLQVEEVPIDTVDRSTLEGTAMAKDGLTVVAGGMITETTADGERKVPVLGDVPLLGALFKEKNRLKQRDQLVLLITPHVFSTPEEAEAISRNRIGDLTQAPSQIDVYLDDLERTRSHTARGRDANARVRAAAPEPVPPRSALEQNYIDLTRFAAERMRLPGLAQAEHARIRSVGLRSNRPFFLVSESAIEARPKRSWRQEGLYVTAVEARNLAAVELTLDERRFAGQWLAAAVQSPTLPPNTRTFVYLVSDRPFEQAAAP